LEQLGHRHLLFELLVALVQRPVEEREGAGGVLVAWKAVAPVKRCVRRGSRGVKVRGGDIAVVACTHTAMSPAVEGRRVVTCIGS